METKEIEFEKLRHAYVVVKKFLEAKAFEEMKSLDTKIEQDLGLAGEDTELLLLEFVEKYEADWGNFNFDKYFTQESELTNPINTFLTLLTLSIWLPLRSIELLSRDKIKIEKPVFTAIPQRDDLTFRDMITWYVEGQFREPGMVKYKLKIKGGEKKDK